MIKQFYLTLTGTTTLGQSGPGVIPKANALGLAPHQQIVL